MIIDIYEDKEKRCYNRSDEVHNSYGPDETHSNGFKTYYIKGDAHNPYGPAVFHPEDDITKYYLDGDELTKEKWEQLKHGD